MRVLAALLVLSFAACAKKPAPQAPAAPPTEATPAGGSAGDTPAPNADEAPAEGTMRGDPCDGGE